MNTGLRVMVFQKYLQNCGGEEVSVNPYYILCYLENKKLKYAYS